MNLVATWSCSNASTRRKFRQITAICSTGGQYSSKPWPIPRPGNLPAQKNPSNRRLDVENFATSRHYWRRPKNPSNRWLEEEGIVAGKQLVPLLLSSAQNQIAGKTPIRIIAGSREATDSTSLAAKNPTKRSVIADNEPETNFATDCQ